MSPKLLHVKGLYIYNFFSLWIIWPLTFLHPVSWEFLLWDTEGLFASLFLSADFQDREPLLFGPSPHDGFNWFAARLSQSPPQILSEGVLVFMPLQVGIHSFPEGLQK